MNSLVKLVSDNYFKLLKLWPFLLFILYFAFRDTTQRPWTRLFYQQQQSLYQDIPLPAVQVAGTHNSYCSTKYGYNLCNNGEIPRHFLSLTEQLDRGFRLLELDVHYIPELIETSDKNESSVDAFASSAFRLCHPCGDGCFWLSLICFKRIPDYGREHRGCSRHALLLEQAFGEIVDWLKVHPDEFVFVYLDSFIGNRDAGIALNRWVEKWSQSLAFSPRDLLQWRRAQQKGHGGNNEEEENNKDVVGWPSIRQLLQMGKQLLVDSRMDETVVEIEEPIIFPDLSNIRWPYSQLQYLVPLNDQRQSRSEKKDMSRCNEESAAWIGCRIRSENEEERHVYFPYFSRMVWEGRLHRKAWKQLKDAIACGYSFRVDVPNLSTWNRILELFEWSYSSIETSTHVQGHSCTQVTTTDNRRWISVDRKKDNITAPLACVCEQPLLPSKGWNHPSPPPNYHRSLWWLTPSHYPCLSKHQAQELVSTMHLFALVLLMFVTSAINPNPNVVHVHPFLLLGLLWKMKL